MIKLKTEQRLDGRGKKLLQIIKDKKHGEEFDGIFIKIGKSTLTIIETKYGVLVETHCAVEIDK